MKRRQELAIFNMSFLDCISCGFGATVLIFMLMKHAAPNPDAMASVPRAQVSGAEDKLLDDRQQMLVLRAALDNSEKALQTGKTEAERLRKQIDQARSAMQQAEPGAQDGRARVLILENELKALESKVQAMRAAAKDDSGDAVRSITGEGRRQYLSGLSVHGGHILVLVDTSGSMLAETIVEAIRRRNMSESARLASPKWRRAVASLDWIASQMPADAQFQVYGFNQEATPAIADSAGQWLPVSGGQKLDAAVASIRRTVPGKGTSLSKAFAVAATLHPAPDQIYLITDGLPTLGRSGGGGTVSGKQRLRYFNEATTVLPRKLPVNVILMPMEGDPTAAGAFWQLAQVSGGAYMNPSLDWP
ncbi:MAG: VWA domain-containing protein [Panacagrimonas sp.]